MYECYRMGLWPAGIIAVDPGWSARRGIDAET
jgi:hypothetical protein